MAASQHTIAGTVLTMPVRVRRATYRVAMFSVNARAAQRMIDYSGLQVARVLPGRAAVSLILAHFIDGDLGSYHELSTVVQVRQPGSNESGLSALQSAFVHHMLVDQAFTLEAGRTIWGFPKVMADFKICEASRFGCEVRADDQLLVDMEFRRGLPIPPALPSRERQLRSYAHRDGHTLETEFTMSTVGSRYRPGGVRLRLGDHPYAKELASLGLPKRAMLSTFAANVVSSFGDAREIS
ncbi:acetoacetate decarboxylase family protein [Mycobacterium sp. ML4]